MLEVVARRQSGDQLLVLFLGSTVGNFDRPAAEVFLSEVRRQLAVGDALLLARGDEHVARGRRGRMKIRNPPYSPLALFAWQRDDAAVF